MHCPASQNYDKKKKIRYSLIETQKCCSKKKKKNEEQHEHKPRSANLLEMVTHSPKNPAFIFLCRKKKRQEWGGVSVFAKNKIKKKKTEMFIICYVGINHLTKKI